MPDSPQLPNEARPIRIATRGSALALAQANQVRTLCEERFPDREFILEVIRTTGDQWLGTSLAAGHLPKGLFTKELETALLEGQADLAVHSLKDLPTELPEGLVLAGVGRRVDPRDVLVVRRGNHSLSPPHRGPVLTQREWLPEAALLATNSTRRAAQVRSMRPDVEVVPIRGNVGTRLRKLADHKDWSGTLLAAAGLHRLHFRIGEDGTLTGPEVPAGLLAVPLSVEEMIPCVGQAALGFEARAGDPIAHELCRTLTDEDTEQSVIAERAFLLEMGGGCQTAVAAHARIQDGMLMLQAVSYLTGTAVRGHARGAPAEAAQLGRDMAARLKAASA